MKFAVLPPLAALLLAGAALAQVPAGPATPAMPAVDPKATPEMRAAAAAKAAAEARAAEEARRQEEVRQACLHLAAAITGCRKAGGWKQTICEKGAQTQHAQCPTPIEQLPL